MSDVVNAGPQFSPEPGEPVSSAQQEGGSSGYDHVRRSHRRGTVLAVARDRMRSLFADRGFADILTGSLFASTAQAANVGLALVSSVIVARFYGAQIMGTLAIIDSLLVLGSIIAPLGTNIGILRLIPEHATRYSLTSAFRIYAKTQYLVALTSLLASGLLFLVSDLVASRVFGKPSLSFFLALAAPFLVPKALTQLHAPALRGLRLIPMAAFIQVLPVLSMLLLLGAATLLVENRHIPIYARLTSVALTAFVGICILHGTFRTRLRPADTVRAVSVRTIASLSMPMLLGTAVHSVAAQAGVLLLGVFRSEAEVAYYAAAARLSGFIVFALGAINSMAAPTFAELYHGGQTAEVLRVARQASRLIFWTTAPILLGLILLGKPLLIVVLGSEFGAAYRAMVFLVLGQFVNAISGSTGVFLSMIGRQKALMKIMLASASLNVALSLALIPAFGIDGAAVAAMMATMLGNLAALRHIKAEFGRTIGYVPWPPRLWWRS